MRPPAKWGRVPRIAARRARGVHLRRAGRRRDRPPGVSQHGAHDGTDVRGTPRSAAQGKAAPAYGHDGNGMTHAFFKAPKNLAESIAGRDAIAEWQRITYGWMGRAPDYKAAFLGTLGGNAEFYEP